MKATPANSANGAIDSPSRHDRCSPKKRVIITTMSSGMSVPTMPWTIATSPVIVWM